MMIDLCKVFGVEEGEDFKLENIYYDKRLIFRIQDNVLFSGFSGENFTKAYMTLNDTTKAKVIKLPKKKEFTDDELAIMRSLPKLYEWIARDGSGRMFMYNVKPKRSDSYWEAQNTLWNSVVMFEHIFNSITWEDEEPVCIDDYVERGGE